MTAVEAACGEHGCANAPAAAGVVCEQHGHRAAMVQAFMIDMGMASNPLRCRDGVYRKAQAQLWLDGQWREIQNVLYLFSTSDQLASLTLMLGPDDKGAGAGQTVEFRPMDLRRDFLPIHRLVYPR